MTDDDSEGWSWQLAPPAQDDLDDLNRTDRNQILDKIDDICDSPWRDPPGYGEPLQNSPYKKVRVGQFRLSVTFDRTDNVMVIARIKRRSGAYTADD